MTDDLAAMRQAAHAREADQLQFLLKQHFHRMEFVRALGVAAEQAHRYTDTFERYHPGEIWARRMLTQIVMTATAPDRSLIEQAMQHFSTPGTANFVKALHDLFEGTQKDNQSEARIGSLVSATVNAMTAELVELYFGERPDEWAAYRTRAQNAHTIALAFWTNEQVAARDTALWLAVIDKVEANQNK